MARGGKRPGAGRKAKGANLKGATVPVRVTRELRSALETAAQQSGARSLSQEIEDRLRDSFKPPAKAQVIHDSFGGRDLFTVFQIAARTADHLKLFGGARWIDDPFLFTVAVNVISTVIQRFRPSGLAEAPPALGKVLAVMTPEEFGSGLAQGALQTISMAPKTSEAPLDGARNEKGGRIYHSNELKRAPYELAHLGDLAKRLNAR